MSEGEGNGPAETAVSKEEEFHALVRRRKRMALLLTLGILSVYFGFIFLLAFNKALVGMKISDRVTLGIPLGLGVIIASWGLSAYFLGWAGQHDEKAEDLRVKWGK